MQQSRKRPWIGTTIDPDMYDLLEQEKTRDERPLSFVLDKALKAWAITLHDNDSTGVSA
jgi:hypothetical protein